MKKKKFYVPPTVEVIRVILESSIAAQSVVGSVKVESWVDDPDPSTSNADIELPF